MAAPLNPADYPVYFRRNDVLMAFTAKDKMYIVHRRGSNIGNTGVTIDHYVTREMVRRHWPYHGQHNEDRVSPAEFKELLQRLFSAYINKIVP